MDENKDTTNSDNTDNLLTPLYPSGERIIWNDSNDARLDGIVVATKKYWRRRHLFTTYFQHRAVPVGTKIAVESPDAVPFVVGSISDPYNADDRCPPTATRVANLARHSPRARFERPADGFAVPNHIIVAPQFIEREDGRLLRSLEYILEGNSLKAKLIEKADGSGTKLLELLEGRAAKAKFKAKAVITAEFSKHVADGVRGELTMASLNAFMKVYEEKKACISREISDEEEVEMINTIAFRSPEIRDAFDLTVRAEDPEDLESALALLEDILRGRELSEDIDRITTNGAAPSRDALAVQQQPPQPPADAQSARIAALEALVAELRDPAKDPKKQWVKAPRGANNEILRWIPGMQPCKCKKQQPGDTEPGGHLRRDCTTFPPPANKAGKQPKAKEEPARHRREAHRPLTAPYGQQGGPRHFVQSRAA